MIGQWCNPISATGEGGTHTLSLVVGTHALSSLESWPH